MPPIPARRLRPAATQAVEEQPEELPEVAAVADLYEQRARQCAQALLGGRGTIVVRSTRTVDQGPDGQETAAGFDPLLGDIALPPSAEEAFTAAFRALWSGASLEGDQVLELKEAGRTLLFENLRGIYPSAAPHLPGQPAELLRDVQRYTWPSGFALEVGHLDWMAQAKVGEFLRLVGIVDVAPGLDEELLTQPYSAQVGMAKGFAAAGGYRLLGFPDVATYLQAQARQNDATRLRWMAGRIIRGQEMEDTQELRDQLTGVITWAFRMPMLVGPGNEEVGWQKGAEAYRALEPLMARELRSG